jgi:hypothetical protein
MAHPQVQALIWQLARQADEQQETLVDKLKAAAKEGTLTVSTVLVRTRRSRLVRNRPSWGPPFSPLF